MKTTSDGFKALAEDEYGVKYYHKITLNGTEITEDINDFKYSHTCNGEDTLTIGNVGSAMVKFSINRPSINLANEEIEVFEGIDVNGTIEYVKLGIFKVLKPANDRGNITYQCVDRMTYLMNMPFFSELTDNVTDVAILNEICTQVGITLANTDLISHTLPSAPIGYTRREVISYMSQLQGKNGIINDEGNLELIWYSQTDYVVDDDKIYYEGTDSINGEMDYTLEYIECVVRKEEEEVNLKSGNGIVGMSFENPFMTQEILDEVFAKIGGFTYRPVEVQFLGDFRLEVGDIVSVTTNNSSYIVPIMELTHDSDGGVKTTIQSIAETESENGLDLSSPSTKAMDRYYANLVLINKALVNKLDVDQLDAVAAEIQRLVVNEIDGKYAEIDFANIDTAKVDKNIVSLLLAEVGLIDRATIVEGHVTKLLDAVEINANSIKSGTIVTDRLLLSGAEGSILFELNNLGELTSTNVDSLDGYVITPRTINADRIVAGSITANEIDVEDIFAQDITATGTIRGATFIGGKIQSDNYNPNSTGMTWNLNENTFKSPNMSWNSEGRLSVNDIILSGLTAYEAEKFEDITHGICEKRMQMSIDEIISFITRESDNVGISSFLLKSGSLYVGKMVDEEVQYLSFDPDSTSTDFIVKCGSCTIEATTHISRPVTMGSTLRVASDVYFANGFDYKVDLNGNATFNKLNIVSETNLQDTLSVTGATTLKQLTVDSINNYVLGNACAKNSIAEVKENSTDLVTSGAVYSKIASLDIIRDLSGAKVYTGEMNAGTAMAISNTTSSRIIYVQLRALITLQIGNIVNVYSVYNHSGSGFQVAPVVLNQSSNHGTVFVNSSGQLCISNGNANNVLRVFVVYV